MGPFLALTPAVHAAAGTADSELGAAVKWDILTSARRARAEIPDACLWSAEATLRPDGDSFRGHFWSEKNAAHYIVLVRAHSQVPDDPEKGDVSASQLCIRDVPIGSDAQVSLELLKIEKESMGDD